MNIAVIMAGGRGERMRLSYPKQFALLRGIPLAAYSLKAFSEHKDIDGICVVCDPSWREKFTEILEKYCKDKFQGYILPGKTRRESSRNAIETLYERYAPDTVVLIHDAARPGVTDKIISANLEGVKKTGAACTAIKCRDTMCVSESGTLGEDVRRDNVVALQTPQTFYLGKIKEAHDNYEEKKKRGEFVPDITDDTGLVKFMGGIVVTVQGAFSNMKVTEPGDLEMLEGSIFENEVKKEENN